MIEIPWQNLPEETLSRMLEEIVTRDGTDYGAQERPVSARLEEAKTSLREGKALLTWDEESESASLIDRDQLTID
jgi:uncharacterized protein YheU (UPF0270 family)